MNRFLSLMLIIAISLFSANVYAAFPAHPKDAAPSQEQQVVVKKSEISNAMKMSPAPAPHGLSGSEVGLVIGILALVFGIVSFVAGIPGLIFAAAAIILGLIGLEGSWRGLSLAGLILGIVGGTVALIKLIIS